MSNSRGEKPTPPQPHGNLWENFVVLGRKLSRQMVYTQSSYENCGPVFPWAKKNYGFFSSIRDSAFSKCAFHSNVPSHLVPSTLSNYLFRIIIRGGTVTGGYGFGYVSDMYPSLF